MHSAIFMCVRFFFCYTKMSYFWPPQQYYITVSGGSGQRKPVSSSAQMPTAHLSTFVVYRVAVFSMIENWSILSLRLRVSVVKQCTVQRIATISATHSTVLYAKRTRRALMFVHVPCDIVALHIEAPHRRENICPNQPTSMHRLVGSAFVFPSTCPPHLYCVVCADAWERNACAI